jgi:hypothetical protein
MAETVCLPTGIAKASKPHSQAAQKYAENSGFALVVKSAPARQAGSISSLLGVLHVASWHQAEIRCGAAGRPVLWVLLTQKPSRQALTQ